MRARKKRITLRRMKYRRGGSHPRHSYDRRQRTPTLLNSEAAGRNARPAGAADAALRRSAVFLKPASVDTANTMPTEAECSGKVWGGGKASVFNDLASQQDVPIRRSYDSSARGHVAQNKHRMSRIWPHVCTNRCHNVDYVRVARTQRVLAFVSRKQRSGVNLPGSQCGAFLPR